MSDQNAPCPKCAGAGRYYVPDYNRNGIDRPWNAAPAMMPLRCEYCQGRCWQSKEDAHA